MDNLSLNIAQSAGPPLFGGLWKSTRTLYAPSLQDIELVMFAGYGDTKAKSEFAQHARRVAALYGVPCKVATVCQTKDGSVSIGEMLEAAQNFIRQECTSKNLILVGHSLGGLIAHRTAQTLPDKKILGLITGSPPVNHWQDYMEHALSRPAGAHAWHEKGRLRGPAGLIYTKQFIDDLAALTQQVINSPPLQCPVRIIGADDDGLVLRKSVEAFVNTLSAHGNVQGYYLSSGSHIYTGKAGKAVRDIISTALEDTPAEISSMLMSRHRNNIEIIIVPGYGNAGNDSFSRDAAQVAGVYGLKHRIVPVCSEGDGTKSVPSMVEELKTLIERESAPNVFLMGHCLGALVAQRTAQILQDKNCLGVVAGGPPVNFHEDYLQPGLSFEAERQRVWDQQGWMRGHKTSVIYTKQLVTGMADLTRNIVEASPLAAPVRVIMAQDDRLAPPQSVKAFSEQLIQKGNEVQSYVLPEGGHAIEGAASETVREIISASLEDAGYKVPVMILASKSRLSQFADAVAETFNRTVDRLSQVVAPYGWKDTLSTATGASTFLATMACIFYSALAPNPVSVRPREAITDAMVSKYGDWFHNPIAVSGDHVIVKGRDIGEVDALYRSNPHLVEGQLHTGRIETEANGRKVYIAFYPMAIAP